LVLEALKFMVLGMGIVYIFLLILILAIEAQAKIIAKYFPDEEVPNPQGASGSANSSGISKKTVAAIVGAITAHKSK
jgi:oxaloacetate decarboxylase gamma subunit